MKYIPVSSIMLKLNKAARKGEVLYIQGGIGIGKTAAVTHYLRRKKSIWYDGEQGFIENIPPKCPEGDEVIVVDGISFIRDYQSKQYILQIIRRGGRQIILIGRGELPDWLAAVSTQVPFRFASAEDFLLDKNELEKALIREQDTLDEETADKLFRLAYKNPLLCGILNSRIVKGELTNENIERARLTYFYVLDDRFFNLLNREERAALIALCSFDHFSLALARRVTLNPEMERILEGIVIHDACLEREGTDYWIPQPYLDYLRWKQSLVLNPYKRADLFRMAASYYVEKNDLFGAVNCIRKAEDKDLLEMNIVRICEDPNLVVRNLDKIHGLLDMLTMEQSLNRPLIMATRSMVYSLEMNINRSEIWYERLEEYGKSPEWGKTERIETEFYLAYLDLILPHRSSTRWVDRLQHYLEARKRWNGQRKVPSITLFSHSVLNGLFDFSRLIREKSLTEKLLYASRQDKREMREDTAAILKLLIQEISLEQGKVDEMVFNTQINRVILEGERREMDDLCMAAIIHYGKMKVLQGDLGSTEVIHRRLLKKIEKDEFLAKTLRSINVWISLLRGESTAAEEWLLQAPNSRDFFSLLDKDDYVLKARIEILKGDYQEANILLTRLEDVFEEYKRDYLCIQVKLLRAVLFHRMDSSRWQGFFIEALKRADSFAYIRVIADEGAAVLPLFEDLPEKEKEQFNQSWYVRVEKAVREMARFYPNYMKENKLEEIALTKAEKKVLNYLCFGKSSEEICEELHISYSGLKYHKRNIYRKLEVHSLDEAINAAKLIGING